MSNLVILSVKEIWERDFTGDGQISKGHYWFGIERLCLVLKLGPVLSILPETARSVRANAGSATMLGTKA